VCISYSIFKKGQDTQDTGTEEPKKEKKTRQKTGSLQKGWVGWVGKRTELTVCAISLWKEEGKVSRSCSDLIQSTT